MKDFAPANQILLQRRQQDGDDIGALHRVQHICYFANHFMAQAAESALRATGFDTVLLNHTIKSQVLAMHFVKLTNSNLNHACDDVALVVEHYGGDYAGWDSPMVTASPVLA